MQCVDLKLEIFIFVELHLSSLLSPVICYGGAWRSLVFRLEKRRHNKTIMGIDFKALLKDSLNSKSISFAERLIFARDLQSAR